MHNNALLGRERIHEDFLLRIFSKLSYLYLLYAAGILNGSRPVRSNPAQLCTLLRSKAHLFCIAALGMLLHLMGRSIIKVMSELTGEPTAIVTNILIGWLEKFFAAFLHSLVQTVEDAVKVDFFGLFLLFVLKFNTLFHYRAWICFHFQACIFQCKCCYIIIIYTVM